MASVQQGGGSSPAANADINITPLVDVMLVLLIVFMISAPMLEQGLDVKLPQAAAEVMKPETEKITVTVAVDKEQRIAVNSTANKEAGARIVPAAELKNVLMAVAADPESVTVNVEADASLQYGYLAKVISTIRQAKIKNVNLMTQPNEDGSGS